MPRQAHSDPGPVIGYEAPATVYCRSCAPAGLVDGGHYGLRAGSEFGVPYHCDVCGDLLKPCEHEWSEWRPWFSGGEFRICGKDRCGETEHR